MITSMASAKTERRRRWATEECLAAWDRLERHDRTARRLGARIGRRQEELRRHAGARAWPTYLAIEELVNERHAHLLERFVRLVSLNGEARRASRAGLLNAPLRKPCEQLFNDDRTGLVDIPWHARPE